MYVFQFDFVSDFEIPFLLLQDYFIEDKWQCTYLQLKVYFGKLGSNLIVKLI